MQQNQNTAILILKLGLAFAFIYPALSAFIDPTAWVGYIPQWVDTIVPRDIFLLFFSPIEIVVALGILFWESTIPLFAAGAMLIGIVLFNIGELSVVFRDLSLASVAYALILFAKK